MVVHPPGFVCALARIRSAPPGRRGSRLPLAQGWPERGVEAGISKPQPRTDRDGVGKGRFRAAATRPPLRVVMNGRCRISSRRIFVFRRNVRHRTDQIREGASNLHQAACWRESKRTVSSNFAARSGRPGRRSAMLYTIAVVLLVLWLLGLVSSYTIGGFIHILLVIAVVMFLVGVIGGRRA